MKTLKKYLLILAVIIVAMLLLGSQKPEKASEYISYTVQPGDTLWSISEEITPIGRDLRYTVREIQDENGIENSVIRVGQVILVPVYEEE
jgi:LysM repeat protein